jgi:hypothetical protein
MKKTLIATLALATLVASPAFAAQTKNHARAATQSSDAYARYLAPDHNAVVFGNRVVGEDPDRNIRGQIMRDPIPNEY